MTNAVKIIPSLAAILFGVMAGFFWTFSNAIIPALAAIDAGGALIAMKEINVAVRNPVFGLFFFGAALVAAGLVAQALLCRDRWRSVAHLAAGLGYLAGVLLVTVARNVPMNRALAGADAGAAPAGYAAEWLADWLFWNDIRMAVSFGAFVVLIAALSHWRVHQFS